MNALFKRIVTAKAASRRDLAALPFADKLRILDRLRERSLLIAANPLRQRRGKTRAEYPD